MREFLESAGEWHEDRVRLNHGWLKNQFLPSVGTIVNVAAGRLVVQDGGRALLEETVEGWRSRAPEAKLLAERVVTAISPARLFCEPPLSNSDADTRTWLPELLHELWLSRHRITESVQEVVAAVDRASSAAEALADAAAGPSRAVSTMHDEALAFYRACESVGRALSALPSRVLFP